MNNSVFRFEKPKNEPVLSYAPNSPERLELVAELERMSSQQIDIPLIIGGKEIRTGNLGKVVMPHDHGHVLATYHMAGEKEVRMAIEAAVEARKKWENIPWVERASIAIRVAELIAKKYRAVMNAATMLGQSKNAFQAEIDSACETIDFLRFNAYYMSQIYADQPMSPTTDVVNRMEYRPLEGFVFAVTPFNFTAIASNLCMSPVIMGNAVVWKPATTAILSNYYLMQIYKEAGLPDGIINFIPGKGSVIGKEIFAHREFAGVHFTGSTWTFNSFWSEIARNLPNYRSYPKIVGETGGKDFVMVHPSADVQQVAVALVRGAFEFQGQKCSAASRAYIPKSMWYAVKDSMGKMLTDIKVGDVRNFSNFVNAVIDEAAFDSITGYIEKARNTKDAEIVFGGTYDKSKGYFIQPTVILANDPHFVTMEEEIFGPVLTIHVYEDAKFEETLELVDSTSPYALTGSIFSNDRYATEVAFEKLKYAAGNFYINDKPTGAVVGQQPFGGARASGTNDKAGSYLNLIRWTNPRSIKETLNPPTDYRYPFLAE
ncbi:L-glutamate gamma-semialdehyde dehydrogenase [Acetobacteroides hydrogenigenes]|uniref:L-glutamate gamma-semialdehyde dehydrogenase n=1 Tax=Acetobacteroides hydrogenigenes TaxID=979970 RepID=A0A4V2RQV5_9BACT|nr:L-glutamate gamma-semialdehyde dehydrogenase [Acetobacteroides hydrogenigenes]TCN72981.1 1-pyrroline-5-carboxylate dehydrogenase [Acetobacteroides hydrogenigenes]